MVYLSEKEALIRTVLLELGKSTYVILQANYKDKLKASTEYFTL